MNASESSEKRAIEAGQTARRSLTLTAEHVRLYSEITGDRNPLHYDEAFTARTRFGRLLVQGGLTTGLLHALVAMDLPGPGSVFMSQNWTFTGPVFIGDTITAEARVKTLDNSTGASLTLTSTPTIANGQDGQIITLINDDSADDIVIQDETSLGSSNLRLAGAANCTLGPRDAITLMYVSSLGDWIELSRSNN